MMWVLTYMDYGDFEAIAVSEDVEVLKAHGELLEHGKRTRARKYVWHVESEQWFAPGTQTLFSTRDLGLWRVEPIELLGKP